MQHATYCISKPPYYVSQNQLSQLPRTLRINHIISYHMRWIQLLHHISIHKITRINSVSLYFGSRKKKMMNFLALGLVLTSLVTAGFFSPTPQNPKSSEEGVIVKEGRRVVVVEYEKDDGNTKVLISPQDSHTVDGKGFASNVYDKMSDRVEGVKEGVREASSSAVDQMEKAGNQGEEILNKFRPRELVCDAYGKCKHKIASAFGRATEAAEEKAHEAAEAVSGAAERVKGTVTPKIQETKENVKEEAGKRFEGAKESVSVKAEKLKDKVARTAHKASETVQETKDNLKEEAGRKLEGAKQAVSGKAKAAEEEARKVRREGQKELKEILKHAREVAGDVFDYIAPRERVAPVAAVLHLMGFAVAYGMCVWITFASSYLLAGALPRQQFAMVQSQIYPVYFKAMGCSVGIALLGHLMGPSRRVSPASVVAFQGLNLASSLVMIFTNLMWLEPRATKVMLERMKMEKEEGTGREGAATEPSKNIVDSTAETAGRGPAGEEAAAKAQIIHLSRRLERLNSYSSLLNALTLVSLTWHLVHLSQRLYATC